MDTPQLEEPTHEKIDTWEGERYVRTAYDGPVPIAQWRMKRWLVTLSDEEVLNIAYAITMPDLNSESLRRMTLNEYLERMTPIQYIMWQSPQWIKADLPDFRDKP